MARSNERCIEYPPVEMGFNNLRVQPGQEVHSRALDVRGAKIFCAWVKMDVPSEVVFDYLATDHSIVLQSSDPIKMTPGLYQRCQFGTYGAMQMPAMFLQLRVRNTSDQQGEVYAWAVSQLQ